MSLRPVKRLIRATPTLEGVGDSMGNSGAIAAGDVRWMTAGSGIIYQEMPKGNDAGRMHGFQLWADLPSSLKMTAPGRLFSDPLN